MYNMYNNMNNNIKNHRPVYLNLLKIRLPLPGMVSLAHRVSGVGLFVSLPFIVYLLDLSVSSQNGFQQVQRLLHQPVVVILEILILWAFAHHFFAGIRFLLIDADIGVEKTDSRTGAWLVIGAEVITVLAIVLYGVL